MKCLVLVAAKNISMITSVLDMSPVLQWIDENTQMCKYTKET